MAGNKGVVSVPTPSPSSMPSSWDTDPVRTSRLLRNAAKLDPTLPCLNKAIGRRDCSRLTPEAVFLMLGESAAQGKGEAESEIEVVSLKLNIDGQQGRAEITVSVSKARRCIAGHWEVTSRVLHACQGEEAYATFWISS